LSTKFGADAFVTLSNANITKQNQKHHNVIVTDVIKPEEIGNILNLAWRTGKILFAIDQGFYPKITVFDLIVNQL